MKSICWLFSIGACLLIGLGMGCAITDYGVITDNDQTSNGNPQSGIVNTQGKAHIQESFQVAQIWPDGTDEMIYFVDQKPDGSSTLTTHNNFATLAGPTFHDDLYCNPDWNGCAIFTAPDAPGDLNLFDGRLNANCSGARSLSLLTSTGRYYGECGRARPTLRDRLTLLNMGTVGERYGREGLIFPVGPDNLTLLLDNNAGTVVPLQIPYEGEVFVSARQELALDLTHPLTGGILRRYASFLGEDATEETRLTLRYNGISHSIRMAGLQEPVSTPRRVNALANRHY